MNLKLTLPKSNKYILSVSGGIDSMVLFDYLLKHGFDFVAVHFNHQKRAESILDHELIETVSLSNKIPYHYIKLSIKSGNFQDKARSLRYSNLEEIARKYQTKHIITAHHADDLAETVLMKLMRGSNLLGYSSMQETTFMNDFIYHKPLLKYAKNDLENYAKKYDVHYLEDSSNSQDDYLRNRIRHHIIPLLKSENDILSHLYSFSRQAYLASAYVRIQSNTFLGDRMTFSLSDFNALHDSVKMDVLSLLLERIDAARSYEKITLILKQLNAAKPNISIRLSKDYLLQKNYNVVTVITVSKINQTKNAQLLDISHKKDQSPNNSIELCYNELDFPLSIRTRKPGDILSFPYGHKKLKNFLIEKKVPLEMRNNLSLVVDNKGVILWIPGLFLNQTLGKNQKIYLSIKE